MFHISWVEAGNLARSLISSTRKLLNPLHHTSQSVPHSFKMPEADTAPPSLGLLARFGIYLTYDPRPFSALMRVMLSIMNVDSNTPTPRKPALHTTIDFPQPATSISQIVVGTSSSVDLCTATPCRQKDILVPRRRSVYTLSYGKRRSARIKKLWARVKGRGGSREWKEGGC